MGLLYAYILYLSILIPATGSEQTTKLILTVQNITKRLHYWSVLLK